MTIIAAVVNLMAYRTRAVHAVARKPRDSACSSFLRPMTLNVSLLFISGSERLRRAKAYGENLSILFSIGLDSLEAG